MFLQDMNMPKTFTRKKIFIVALAVFTAFLLLFGRLAYLMIVIKKQKHFMNGNAALRQSAVLYMTETELN